MPSFVQKFTSTYFKFQTSIQNSSVSETSLNRSKPDDSKISRSFVVNKSVIESYTKPKDDHLSKSLNRSIAKKKNSEINDEMNESNFLCNICFCKDSDAIFMECGHGGLCMTCAYDIWSKTDECFLCRETVDYIVRYDNKNRKGDLFKILEIHQEN